MPKLTFKQVCSLAEKHGCEFLSNQYENLNVKYSFRCHSCEFVFKTSILNTKELKDPTRDWCPACVKRKNKENKLLNIKNEAINRGGKLLTKEYTTVTDSYLFECHLKHHFKITGVYFWDGRWCKDCNSSSLGERICREYFNQIFNKKFLSERPEWLISPAGNKMELDGFNQELKIAFEHQGSQHYEKNTLFTQKLSIRKEYDEEKRRICKEKGIKLIEIPELFTLTKLRNLKNVIKEACIEKNIVLPKHFDDLKINISNAYKPDVLLELKNFAKNKNGSCLANNYLGMHVKLDWKCHKCNKCWKASPANILAGKWCPYCGRKTRSPSIKDVHKLAQSRGGRCLATEYKNNRTKMRWECSKNHIWEAPWSSIYNKNTWCPECRYVNNANQMRKYSFKDIEVKLENRNWKCLSNSEDYINFKSEIKFECDQGHISELRAVSILNNKQCLECVYEKASEKHRKKRNEQRTSN